MRRFLQTFLLLAAMALSGCASQTTMQTRPMLADNEAMVAPKVIFVIPPPSALGQTVDLAQTIAAHYRNQSYVFDVQIQITPEKLDLVALDGFGRRALTVTWKADKIDYQPAPWLPPILRPADILADFVIVYWPDEVVSSSFRTSGAILAATDGGRKISTGRRNLIVVEYGKGEGWNRSAKLRNLAFGYEIDIQSSAISP